MSTKVIQNDTFLDVSHLDFGTHVNPNRHRVTEMQQNETIFRLMAENCYLKVMLCRNRKEQQAIVLAYAIEFSSINYDPRLHARAYLEAEMKKHGISSRTFLRILPDALKDPSKRLNRLGKFKKGKKQEIARVDLNNSGAGCYCEPD